MSKAPTYTLILLSIFWIVSTIHAKIVSRAFAGSEAALMEYRLKIWAEKHTFEHNLDEILDDYNNLKLGDESDERTFRETIKDIAKRTEVPVWPGFIGLVIGMIGIVGKSSPPPLPIES